VRLLLLFKLLAGHPGTNRRCLCVVCASQAGSSRGSGQPPSSSSSSSSSSAATLSGRCLLVCGVTSDARVWVWELQLPAYPQRTLRPDAVHTPTHTTSSSSSSLALQVRWGEGGGGGGGGESV